MMGMLVTGTSSDILKLSTDDFTLYISGNSENKKFKATNNLNCQFKSDKLLMNH